MFSLFVAVDRTSARPLQVDAISCGQPHWKGVRYDGHSSIVNALNGAICTNFQCGGTLP
jgi:hypothetical protein